MQGIDSIIRMRMAGAKPTFVWVEMMPLQPWCKRLTERPGRHADIHLTPADVASIERQDLRAIVDTHVLVHGPNDDSTDRVARACFNAGAAKVEAFFFDASRPYAERIVKATRYAPEGVKTVWPT